MCVPLTLQPSPFLPQVLQLLEQHVIAGSRSTPPLALLLLLESLMGIRPGLSLGVLGKAEEKVIPFCPRPTADPCTFIQTSPHHRCDWEVQ